MKEEKTTLKKEKITEKELEHNKKNLPLKILLPIAIIIFIAGSILGFSIAGAYNKPTEKTISASKTSGTKSNSKSSKNDISIAKSISASAIDVKTISEQAVLASNASASSADTANKKQENENSSDKNNKNTSDASKTANKISAKTSGRLHVSAGKLVDASNNTVQLHGVSTHGLSWFPEYVNKSAFQTMRDDWGVNTIRLAMYTSEYNGYCNGGNKDELKKLIKNGVSYASELGMYVIIDWHILSDGNPNTHIDESKQFFKEMALLYGSYDNVIFEICNEPNGGVSWGEVKNYANTILSVIRGEGASNVVLIGTPTWSQDIHLAMADPITEYDNIMYTFHFYAATHKTDLQNKLIKAAQSNFPVFVSEFGISDASGNGNLDIDSANKWVSIMNKYNISMVCWNLSNKNEASSIINAACSKKSGWSFNDLSNQGQWLVNTYNGVLKENQSASVPEATTNNANSQNTNNSNNNTANSNNTNSNNSNNNNTSNSAANTNSSSSGTAKANVKCTQTSTWNDGTSDYYQYEVIISNTGNGTLNGWNTTITFSSAIEMNQFWCCNSNINGNSITLTPLDYNMKIEPGACASVGFIIKAPKGLSINNSQIK